MITLVREKGSSLTVSEMDNNLIELSARMLPTTNQTINGEKTFVEAYCDSVSAPVGNQVIRSKDLKGFIDTHLAGSYSINTPQTGVNLTFNTSPILNFTPVNDTDVITKGYAETNLKKGMIISEEAPVNPADDPYNDMWLHISNIFPRNIIAKYIQIDNSWEVYPYVPPVPVPKFVKIIGGNAGLYFLDETGTYHGVSDNYYLPLIGA